jgi:CBS-domain-containing membrane protein
MGLIAADIMSSQVISIRPDDTVRNLAELLTIHRISGVPVLDEDGKLLGVASQSDLVAQNKLPHVPQAITLFDWVIYLEGMGRLKAEMSKMSGTLVRDVMSREIVTVAPNTTLEEVATIMSEKKVHTIPVMEGGRLVGVIGKLDVISSLLR